MTRRIGNHKHHVLVGPKGKQAGLTLGKKIALQMAAIELSAQGRGGGVVTLLLPISPKDWERVLSLTAKGYTFKEVISRQTIRSAIRRVAVSDNLIVQLAPLFEQDKGKSKRAMAAINREFAVWITGKLKDVSPNKVKTIVGNAHPDLLNRTSPDWWKKQLNQRVRK